MRGDLIVHWAVCQDHPQAKALHQRADTFRAVVDNTRFVPQLAQLLPRLETICRN